MKGTDWHRNMKWCLNLDLHIGDFNGDGRNDILCHATQNGYKWISYANNKGQFISTGWHGSFPKCNGQLYTGDYINLLQS